MRVPVTSTAKKEELDAILDETRKEEELLKKKSAEFSKNIEQHLLDAYQRIRGNVKNGLAIVPVERGASGGSYFYDSTTNSNGNCFSFKNYY